MTMGIYKITNLKNDKSYIGLSFDIKRRWKQHLGYAFNTSQEEVSLYHNKLYNAIRKNGKENFRFEIIEECEKEKLKEREIYWIKYYDTYNNGYNLTTGGDISGYDVTEEKHPNAKLTRKDVEDIRKRYANHERRYEVYELYKDKIKLRGFIKVWQGVTWPNVMSEVFSEENKNFHKKNSSMKYEKNGRAKLTVKDVKDIRQRKKDNENFLDVYKDYENIVSKKYLYNVWSGINWKGID